MDKYEYRVKTEQMLDHLEKKEYQKAMDIAESIDWRRVKNASMLNTVSEIYEYNGEFKKGRDILFLAFDRAPGSRKIVYRLGTLALRSQISTREKVNIKTALPFLIRQEISEALF